MAKEKKERQKFTRIVANNFYFLKLAFKMSPTKFILNFVQGTFEAVLWFVIAVWGPLYIIELVETGQSFDLVLKFCVILLVSIFVLELFLSFDFLYLGKSDLKFAKNIRFKLFKKTLEADIDCFDNPDYYDNYIWNLNNGVNKLNETISFFRQILKAVITIGLSGYIVATNDIASIAFVIVSCIGSIFFMIKLNKISYERELSINPLVRKRNYIQRIFYLNDYAKELRMHDIGGKFNRQYESVNGEIVGNIKKYSKKQIVFNFIASFVFASLIIDFIFAAYVAYLAMVLKVITFGAVYGLISSAWRLRGSINGISYYLPKLAQNSLYIDKFRTFIDHESKIKDGTLEMSEQPSEIKLTDVSFSYGTETDFSLKNVSMTISPKEKIAIVGYNGAGKTSLIKLLMRLYEPQSGKIEIDGRDIKEYKLSSLRSKIGVLFQDFEMFADSIKNNVSMDTTADVAKVKDAIQRCGLSEKIDSLSKNIDTNLTREFDDEGVSLSGGERQKLAMARILYKNAPYLILDEPSSALDPQSEYNANRIMAEEANSRTVIFISHRLSTTKMADKIYMFENGEIIEQGTHNELMKNNGKYSQMYKMQAEKYKLRTN